MTKPIAVDLFAGCGGLSKGFEIAGFEVAAAFENWNIAADCYEANFSHPLYRTDLSNVELAASLIRGYAPDIIIGGPPCQDFSHAGKRVEASRASLTESFAQIVTQIRPAYFLMENVDRAQKSNAYARAREIFKEAGYGLTERVLLASRCGVPQRRKRFFCIGVLGSEDGAVDSLLVSRLAENEMTVRDYLGNTLDIECYYRHPRNYNRRGIFSIDEPAPTMRGVNRPVPKGYPGHPNDAGPITPDLRPLTTLERSLIQTFPADFKWVGSKTDCEQMIGNAVPVNLARYVAEAIIIHMQSEQRAQAEAALDEGLFCAWLQEKKGLRRRSAQDVVSRLARANRMVPLESESRPSVYNALLDENATFNNLSASVQSQMHRAVRLYAEFAETKDSAEYCPVPFDDGKRSRVIAS